MDSRAIHQGDIYWLQPTGSETGIPHPHVVIQVDANQTVTACALTSNLKRVSFPGNVLLEAGEGNLPRQSVVEVAKTATLHPRQLGAYIGALSEQRVQQIVAGMRFLQSLRSSK